MSDKRWFMISLFAWCVFVMLNLSQNAFAAETQKADLEERSPFIFASDHMVWTKNEQFFVEEGQLFSKDRDTQKETLLSNHFSSDIPNGKDYLLYNDGVLFYTVFDKELFSIMKYDVEEKRKDCLVQREAVWNESPVNYLPWGQMYLIGKQGDILLYYDCMVGSGELKAISIIQPDDVITIPHYQMGYTCMQDGVVITQGGEGVGDGALYAVSLDGSEEILLSEKCRISSGDYIKDHTFYYLDMKDIRQFELVGFNLEEKKETLCYAY